MVTVDNQIEHALVHLDELVLCECLLLLPINESICNLLLEIARLKGVDNLKFGSMLDLR
jgi:hypothetical protein